MKRFFKAWMIIAVTAVIAIGLAGCDLDGDDDGGFSWPEGIKNTTWGSSGSFISFIEAEDGGSYFVSDSGGSQEVTSGNGNATEGEFKTRLGGEYAYTVSGTGDDQEITLTLRGENLGTYGYFSSSD